MIKLETLEEIESTSDYVNNQLKMGKKPPFAVTSKIQTNGRGRRGKSWESKSGNLFLSIAFEPSYSKLTEIGLLSIAAATLISEWLEKEYAIRSRIKWPNDILVGCKKIAGILCESSTQGSEWSHLVIGIGLNLNHSPETGLDYNATSVLSCLNQGGEIHKVISVDDAAKSLAKFLDEKWQSLNNESVLESFSQRGVHDGFPLVSNSRESLSFSAGLKSTGSLSTLLAAGQGKTEELTSVNHDSQWLYLDAGPNIAPESQDRKWPLICADIGNSTVKICTFEHWNDQKPSRISQVSFEELEVKSRFNLFSSETNDLIERYGSWPIFVLSVNSEHRHVFREYCSRNNLRLIQVRKQPVSCVVGRYRFENLGDDRLALMEGWFRSQSSIELSKRKKYAILVSAGTATTVDIMDNRGQHFGGFIFAGLQLGLDSLANQTDKLPPIDMRKTENQALANLRDGTETVSAMIGGAVHSTVGGIKNILEKYCQKFEVKPEDFSIVITGGNASHLYVHLDCEFEPDVIMQGIRTIVLGGLESTYR